MRMNLCSVSVLVLLTAAITVRCSNDRDNSGALKDVSAPGTPGGQNVLLWIDQAKLFKGSCAQTLPINRANCSTNLAQRPLAEARRLASEAGNSAVQKAGTDVSAEIKKLKDSDSTVIALREQISTLSKQRTALTSSSRSVAGELDKQKANKASVEEHLQSYRQQIAAIDKQLESTPGDQALIKLKSQLLEEQAVANRSLQVATTMIADLEARLKFETDELAAVTQEITATENELKNVYDSLVVNSDRLTQLRGVETDVTAGVAAIEGVFDMISRSDITYRNNLLNAAQQQAFMWISLMSPQISIKPGRYTVESGYDDYCPQRVEPTYESGVLKQVKLTYISPCSGSSNIYVCTERKCRTNGGWEMTIQSEDRYSYKGSSPEAVFKFSGTDMTQGSGKTAETAAETLKQ